LSRNRVKLTGNYRQTKSTECYRWLLLDAFKFTGKVTFIETMV